jgi:uncharacterized iron-regulated protein
MNASRRLLLVCIALLAVLAGAPVRGEPAAPWTSWTAPLGADHRLAGKVWSARQKRFLTPEEVAEAVRAARFVLLGEVHDNSDHHRLQAWLIRQAASGRKPAVVMEMIPRDKAGDLEAYLAKPGADAAGLGPALRWEKSGWPDWKIYQPVAEATLDLGLAMRAGDIDKPTLREAGREGLDVIGADRRRALQLETSLGDALTGALLDELYESHCEVMPKAALRSMVGVQRLRDATLADSLIDAAGAGPAILIAGNGHVRSDRAVPWYLARRAPEAAIVTVMLLEVENGVHNPQDLIPADPDGKPAADYVWFTPRAERDDPCEELRKRFGKPNKKG